MISGKSGGMHFGSQSEGSISRREFIQRAVALGVAASAISAPSFAAEGQPASEALVKFPGPWQFLLPRPSIILVSDQQLEDLQNPDKEVDLSLSATPNVTTLRQICERAKRQGARTVVLAFDEFWSQYRKGQGGKPRELLPDTEEYVQRLARVSKILKEYGLGLELSLLSPLEVGRGYEQKTGESGRWVQYREGYRDPATGEYTVSCWEQRNWTNNKGTIQLKRLGVKVLAFREHRVGSTEYYVVNPEQIVELPAEPEVWMDAASQGSTNARRLVVRGRGDTQLGALDRVLVLVTYATPEMDYFSPKALPFLKALVDQYHAAGVPLNGLYADEMHIQQDWGYTSHHDEGQFALRFVTENLARRFKDSAGFAGALAPTVDDFDKLMVYFCYGQHGFYPNLEARLPAQHVLGASPEGIQRTFLLRRRYYDLLENTVVDLFARAKQYAEDKYGRMLEARAHATWAQSPTIDFWRGNNQAHAPRQYEYTPDFLWSNTVQQASAACSDYFAWNKFLTGGGNDHAEGGWLDRNYYGIALACSTGILNEVPYAYAAAWGMPHEIHRRHQAVCDTFGASAQRWFQAVQESAHRDTDVLMVYPMSLVACEERFGSWMVQYAYGNYVSPRKLVEHARVTTDGQIEMAGRRFGTLVVLFEPLPPSELLDLVEDLLERGGKVAWFGPPPRIDFSGQAVLARWQQVFGVAELGFGATGLLSGGWSIDFCGSLEGVPSQTVLTDFLVDLVYPCRPAADCESVARSGSRVLGARRKTGKGGTAAYFGFRPRDDQSASLGREARTLFEILNRLGAYPSVRANGSNDNPEYISRTSPYVACRFPNGTTAIGIHYHGIEEAWPGGFHRDAKQDGEIVERLKLPAPALKLENFGVNGHTVKYEGAFTVAFRVDNSNRLTAFAGHNCKAIRIDGQDWNFASAPMGVAGWAPVQESRRVLGGAVLEIWVQGEGDLRIPFAGGAGRLFFEGAAPGRPGEEVPCRISERGLEFKADAAWGLRHLYLVEG